MELDTFIRDGGFDPATVSEAQRKTLTAAWKQAAAPGGEQQDHTQAGRRGDTLPVARRAPAEEELDAKLQAARQEEDRKQKIVDIVAGAIQDDPRMIQTAEALGRQAIEGKWGVERFELEMLRARRPNAGVFMYAPAKPEITDAVIEASVCKAAGLPNMEKYYDERTLTAAHTQYPRGMTLNHFILHFARRGGFTGLSVKDNVEAAVKAARRATDIQAAGSWGPSTQGASIGSMLANVANKFLRTGFESVEAEWQKVAARRTANDFKQITTYSLTGDLTFKKLPPGGEIQHGQIDATSYTNQIDTYARMLGLDRRDIINDDIGAFSSVARRLGRGGAIALNKLFWGIFLNNSSFFTAGRNNLITGIASPYLTAATLDAAVQKFRLQTDPDGNILGAMPKLLIVPPALETTARQLMSSTAFVSGSTSSPQLSDNVWAGMFTVVSSAYMQDATLSGSSASTWYLAALPVDLALIEFASLNGQETPIVEEVEADVGMLGRAWRGYFDIGVALQEYRAGVKNTA